MLSVLRAYGLLEAISEGAFGFGLCGEGEWTVRVCYVDKRGDVLRRFLVFLLPEFLTACRISFSVRRINSSVVETLSVHHSHHLFAYV
jgi:hypothetical protein